jgi:hypothetical protein
MICERFGTLSVHKFSNSSILSILIPDQTCANAAVSTRKPIAQINLNFGEESLDHGRSPGLREVVDAITDKRFAFNSTFPVEETISDSRLPYFSVE